MAITTNIEVFYSSEWKSWGTMYKDAESNQIGSCDWDAFVDDVIPFARLEAKMRSLEQRNIIKLSVFTRNGKLKWTAAYSCGVEVK